VRTKPFALSAKAVVLDRAGRCLVLKRSMNSRGNPGKWDFPGGKAEPGETFDQALLREIEQETGLRVSLTRVAGAAESELPERKVAYLIMEASLESGKVRLSDEHDDYQWVPVTELPHVDLAMQFRAFTESYARSEGD